MALRHRRAAPRPPSTMHRVVCLALALGIGAGHGFGAAHGIAALGCSALGCGALGGGALGLRRGLPFGYGAGSTGPVARSRTQLLLLLRSQVEAANGTFEVGLEAVTELGIA